MATSFVDLTFTSSCSVNQIPGKKMVLGAFARKSIWLLTIHILIKSIFLELINYDITTKRHL